MRISEHDQGTEAWLKERIGLITASGVSKLISGTGKPSSSAKGYIDTICAEVLMDAPIETYQSAAMARGNELEPDARSWYELQTDNEVSQHGLCIRDELGAACSPDGFIEVTEVDGILRPVGGLEIKCPMPHTHVSYLRSGKCPTDYIPQVQMCMWITGAQWWDFVSYHPLMPKLMVRVPRDQDYIDIMGTEVAKARAAIDKHLEQIERDYT